MSWNHRILATEHKGEIFLNIHEVYYNDKGVPDSYTANPVSVSGETLEDLKWVLEKMKDCLSKPILWGDEKFPQEKQ